jgi:hypothetical protein
MNPWEAHFGHPPPGYPTLQGSPRPTDGPSRQSWSGRGPAVTTIVFSCINGGVGLVGLTGLALFSLMFAPWWLVGQAEGEDTLRVVGFWLLIHAVPILCCSVLLIVAAFLLIRHKLIGRGLAVVASLLEIAVFAAFWAGLFANVGQYQYFPTGWGWAVGIALAAPTTVCALLPGTRRWCSSR